MKEKIDFETERLSIRLLKPEDVTEEYVAGLNDPAVNKYMWVRNQKQTKSSMTNFVNSKLCSEDAALLGLFLKDDRCLVGTIGLSGISYYHYCLGVGICLFAKKYWGEGLGTEALKGVKDYIFCKMGFHYIEAGIFEENKVSQKLFSKAGFECYAKIENKYRYDDRFVNVWMYRTINPDFNLSQRIAQ